MADWFVGPVMKKIIDKCFEYMKDQVKWQTGMKEEMQRLRFIHPQIQAVLSVYNQVDQIKNLHLNRWYWQLRDAIDEADDVLDDFEYRKHKEQVSNYKTTEKVVQIFQRAVKNDPDLKKLEEAVRKLDKISAEVSSFLNLLDSAKQEEQQQQLELHKKRETGSVIKNALLGRSKEMDFVNRWLQNTYEAQSSDTIDLYKNISLLSVVGHGGMGKTTLLQHIYKDATLFDVKIWVCISTNFDAKTVIKNILESLQNQTPHLESLAALQNSLQSKVTSKKFLLVLDDVWEADEAKWEDVLAPLQHAYPGSKILITTRLDSVATNFAKMIKKRKETLSLKGLEEDECFQLLNSHAFAGVESPDEEFRSIARKMVEKLSRCPLAAKVMGGILNSYIDKSYWVKVLNTNIGKLGLDQNHLLPILKLSYIHLPKFLQKCFSFCCIFPQDHEFDKDDLVRMWIALGFIEPSNILEETLEDTGRRYFNILVQKSFFDEFHNDYDKAYYKMHDLLHELAQFVSVQECFRIADDRVFSIPKTTRHLSINGSSLKAALKKMGEFKNLRSLFLYFPQMEDEDVIYEILKASKSIRLLAINFPSYNYNMPEKIDCLIHLRYLKVKCLGYLKLPRSTSHLYHLQFIISERHSKLEMNNIGWKELMPNENCQLMLDKLVVKGPSATQLIMEPPRRISSFRFLTIEENKELVSFPTQTEQWFQQQSSSLFDLRFHDLESLQSLPSSLENLSSLETLHVSFVPQLKLLPIPPASLVTLKLHYLKSLQCLPSSLSNISSLRDIHLKELENLDCLPTCLPTLLRMLTIYKVPRLLELPDLPSSLERLELGGLKSLKCLPSSLSAISSLETLKLTNIPFLKSLPDLPSSLRYLFLEELENLDCLPSCLPTLIELEIYKVPGLLELPDLPVSLKDLYIRNCHPQLMERYPIFHRGR